MTCGWGWRVRSAVVRKLTALRAMATQTAGLLDLLGADAYAEQVAEEAFVDATADSAVVTRPVTGRVTAFGL